MLEWTSLHAIFVVYCTRLNNGWPDQSLRKADLHLVSALESTRSEGGIWHHPWKLTPRVRRFIRWETSLSEKIQRSSSASWRMITPSSSVLSRSKLLLDPAPVTANVMSRLRSTRPLSASHYNCQPPMLHIKNPSPCLRNSSSPTFRTRQQPTTIVP